MVTIGEKAYKLIMLDTNALREIVLNANNAGKGFLTKFFAESSEYAPCFSVFSVFELRPYQDIYEKFLNFFDVMSCMMFYPCRTILQQEYAAFLNDKPMQVDLEVAYPSSPFFKNPSLKLRGYLNTSFANAEFSSTMRNEIAQLDQTTKDWEVQRITGQFSVRFMNPQAMDRQYFLTKEKAAIKKDLANWGVNLVTEPDVRELPGARLMEYCHYIKVHQTKKSS